MERRERLRRRPRHRPSRTHEPSLSLPHRQPLHPPHGPPRQIVLVLTTRFSYLVILRAAPYVARRTSTTTSPLIAGSIRSILHPRPEFVTIPKVFPIFIGASWPRKQNPSAKAAKQNRPTTAFSSNSPANRCKVRKASASTAAPSTPSPKNFAK